MTGSKFQKFRKFPLGPTGLGHSEKGAFSAPRVLKVRRCSSGAFEIIQSLVRRIGVDALGNPTNSHEATDIGRASLVAASDGHARSLLPLLRTLRSEGNDHDRGD
jgi:hypothetical protein